MIIILCKTCLVDFMLLFYHFFSIPLLHFTLSGDDAITQLTCPRMYVVSAERHTFQLRAHVYQARDLPAGDKTGLSGKYKQ